MAEDENAMVVREKNRRMMDIVDALLSFHCQSIFVSIRPMMQMLSSDALAAIMCVLSLMPLMFCNNILHLVVGAWILSPNGRLL